MPVPAPDWVSFEAAKTNGLDLLGLRAPVQAIGNELINGVTTVTPKLRYFSVITWIIWRYAKARLPDDWAPFSRFAAAQEAVVVIANLLNDRNIRSMVGADKAGQLVDANRKTFPLEPLVQNIAFNIYATSSRQLGLTHQIDGSDILGLTKERGFRLATAFDSIVNKSSYGARLSKDPAIERVSRDDLEELSDKISLDRIPHDERQLLTEALIPSETIDPKDAGERRRRESYTLLLWLSSKKASAIDEYDLFDAAREIPRDVPNVLRNTLDGWLDYIIRDVLAVAHETVFEAVLHQVDTSSAARGAPATAADVIAALLNAVDEHNDILRRVGLFGKAESIQKMSFHKFLQKIQGACKNNENTENGLKRWRAGLSEIELYDNSLDAGAAAAALLPAAWCLAAERIAPSRQATSAHRQKVMAIGDIFQIGLANVVLPKIDEFLRDNRSLLEVMAELVTRTVQQHLRVAWTRMSAPRGKDVSVLIADVEAWSRNNTFRSGRTDSRLGVAIGWLEQLSLVNENGITKEGQRVLDQSIRSLERT